MNNSIIGLNLEVNILLTFRKYGRLFRRGVQNFPYTISKEVLIFEK